MVVDLMILPHTSRKIFIIVDCKKPEPRCEENTATERNHAQSKAIFCAHVLKFDNSSIPMVGEGVRSVGRAHGFSPRGHAFNCLSGHVALYWLS